MINQEIIEIFSKEPIATTKSVKLKYNGYTVGEFKSLNIVVRNQAEAYIPFGQRFARSLEAETIICGAIEEGLIKVDIAQDLFGLDVIGFRAKRAKMPRFDVEFSHGDRKYVIRHCRVDMYNFGATSGEHILVRSVQFTALTLEEIRTQGKLLCFRRCTHN